MVFKVDCVDRRGDTFNAFSQFRSRFVSFDRDCRLLHVGPKASPGGELEFRVARHQH
jgi:hypothetical protein